MNEFSKAYAALLLWQVVKKDWPVNVWSAAQHVPLYECVIWIARVGKQSLSIQVIRLPRGVFLQNT